MSSHVLAEIASWTREHIWEIWRDILELAVLEYHTYGASPDHEEQMSLLRQVDILLGTD